VVKIFINGGLVDADVQAADGAIDPTDRGLTLGDGVFETMAVCGAQISHLAAHLARLRQGLDVLGFDAPMDDGGLQAALENVVQANAIAEGVLRLTVTRGPAPRGLAGPATPSPSLIITGTKQESGPTGPVTAIIATGTRRNEHSPLSRIKSLNYLDNILALREAQAKGADEALLLNGAGNLTSASTANVFAVIDGALVTPPGSDGVLGGVMRAEVLRELGGTERTLTPDDLARASEAFLTNSLSIRALVAVDGVAIGTGPVTKQAQKLG
jgi:branched-chain amino acid aminotransferase